MNVVNVKSESEGTVADGRLDEEPGTQAIHRTVNVLFAVGDGPPRGVGLTEISRELGLSKATALRSLRVLVDRGLLDFDEDSQRYRLGLSILGLAAQLVSGLDVRSEALPALERLSARTGETVHLGVLDGSEVVYIEKVESPHSVRMYSRVGMRMPAFSTGVGKALLAWIPTGDLDKLLPEELRSHSGRVVDRAQLAADLATTRRRGFAMDIEENEIGISCAAAPVFDHMQNPVASISIAGPSIRMDPDRLVGLGELVKEAADEVSIRLGSGVVPT